MTGKKKDLWIDKQDIPSYYIDIKYLRIGALFLLILLLVKHTDEIIKYLSGKSSGPCFSEVRFINGFSHPLNTSLFCFAFLNSLKLFNILSKL